ncbi:EamA family transporter [Planktothrix sp. FACHB-1375]|uniref:EamA family transporter n=2 Tax=Aerosakkonema funiforme TaxID=1246630 RepID=A0A926VER0_9CYAN|nr:EamA family transporter [Aerosakkonema funiforme FACHB-1375]
MNWQEVCLLLATVLFGATGQFFLKTGALKLGKVNSTNFVRHILQIITVPELIYGLICYGLGTLGYIFLLTRIELSIVGPSVALSYVFSVLLGRFFFREPVPLSRLIGLGLIVSGVILVVWRK